MKIVKQVLKVIFVCIVLYSVLVVLRHPHEEYYNTKDEYIYAHGNASDSVRAEIVEQLQKFQAGYTQRDTTQLGAGNGVKPLEMQNVKCRR